MDSSHPRRSLADRTHEEIDSEPPARGSHNRPWQAEEEYQSLRHPRTLRSSYESKQELQSSSSYARYLEQKQRDDRFSTNATSVRSKSIPEALRDERLRSPVNTSTSREKSRAAKKHRNVVEEVAASLKPSADETDSEFKKPSTRRKRPDELVDLHGQAPPLSQYSDIKAPNLRNRSDVNEIKLSSRELRARRLRQQQEERSSIPTDRGGHKNTSTSPSLSSNKARADLAMNTRKSTLEESVATRAHLETRVLESSLASASATNKESISDPVKHVKKGRNTSVGGLMTASGSHPQRDASASIGWSTLAASRSRRSLSMVGIQSGGVDPDGRSVTQYMSQRNNTASGGTLPRLSLPVSGDSVPSLKILRNKTSASFSDDETSSDEDSVVEDELGVKDSFDSDGEWSLKVSIVSGVDFPAPVVPNLPLSPVIRLSLIHLDDVCKARSGDIISTARYPLYSTSPKVLAKRDNGAVEFHEEFRWDCVAAPENLALIVQLDSRAVLAPKNVKESPLAVAITATNPGSRGPSGINRTSAVVAASSRLTPNATEDLAGISGIGSLFRRPTKKTASEMETANAAAAVAKLLVEGAAKEEAPSSSTLAGPLFDSKATVFRALASNQSEVDVKLRPMKGRRSAKMTSDFFIGCHIVPLASLPLAKAALGPETARLEQWFELITHQGSDSHSKSESSPSNACTRNPSVLVEISVSSLQLRDESEDEFDGCKTNKMNASFSKRASHQIRSQLKDDEVVEPCHTDEEPELIPGVIDFVCVVGARDIGNQKQDDGSSGWVNSSPECCVLEQFPDDQFHALAGRSKVLPNKIEWFCFPEGCRLWRGTTPPNLDELGLKRFSASSPGNISTSIASFDACLGCTTSFSWFVIGSHTEEYGSEHAKMFGAVIRFFVPAPTGIDPTQDDFAQTFIDAPSSDVCDLPEGKRLWVPIGICLTSSIPIIGTMEAVLLRLCEALAAVGITGSKALKYPSKVVQQEVVNLICGYQRPIPGVVHCSVPFLKGGNFHLALAPPGGLPSLPHGNAVSSVCRLLGADGFVHVLAAVLTECKLILHSDDVANLCLVSEVMIALIYPFVWSLPYIPVLPLEMMEFVEAPLSYLLGIPTCNMKLIDTSLLEDVVVVDLDKDCSSLDYSDGTYVAPKSKTPMPLPATLAGNLSRAVYRLLKAEENDPQEPVSVGSQARRVFPRLDAETNAERVFRVTVAIEMCSLVRGYQDCLMYASSSQPVFNVDRFLQIAPALFEEQRGTSAESGEEISHFVLSPRSRRFMSIFVNCQHFHQFLEILESTQASFFHEIMTTVHADGSATARRLPKRIGLSIDFHKNMESLCGYLQKLENKIPTYRVHRLRTSPDFLRDLDQLDFEVTTPGARFPRDLLQQIVLSESIHSVGSPAGSDQGEGVKHVSIEYLMELEKNPWKYQKLFEIGDVSAQQSKVKLREAIGERRYRAWKLAIEQEKFDCDDLSVMSEDPRNRERHKKIDFEGLIASATSDMMSAKAASQKHGADAKDREAIRMCLEWALASELDEPELKGRDLLAESAIAFQNPSARRFLLSVLKQRSSSQGGTDPKGRRRSSFGSSKLEPGSFDILLRLGTTLLDACVAAMDYESAYSVLKMTAGIYTITGENDNDVAVAYMTELLGLHRIYADLEVWERAKQLHLSVRKGDKGLNGTADENSVTDEEADDYEAAVATLYEMLGYGIPADEMARFGSYVSQRNGWFASEKGHTLMLLARRLATRREIAGGSTGSPRKKSDLELMMPVLTEARDDHARKQLLEKFRVDEQTVERPITKHEDDGDGYVWIESGWCHPAAHSSRRLATVELTRRQGTQTLLNLLNEQKTLPDTKKQNPKLMKRSAVTTLACLGSSVVVTGGLDGGVFLARKVRCAPEGELDMSENIDKHCIRGVHLDWGSSGSRYAAGSVSSSLDGEFGVGSVSCLAATFGNHLSDPGLLEPSHFTKDVLEPPSEEELLGAMEGFRVVAGTTCGDLRVWAVKDVFSAVFHSNGNSALSDFTHLRGDDANVGAINGAASKFIHSRRGETTDFSAGCSLTRLKFSLRGRALSGHRGGVSCIDVPTSIYRPESIVSGGADGLIKLWNLRTPGSFGSRRVDPDRTTAVHSLPNEALSPKAKAASTGDALCILSGHGGRILCVKTAWHGDRLISGGADRTVRVWDLAGGVGKCLLSMSGHVGWVTHVRYWGQNTIVSASTDRSISLWDARVRSSPLFTLRHHRAPISDVLVGARTDHYMFSAAGDGVVAAWDVRRVSGSSDKNPQAAHDGPEKHKHSCMSVRNPSRTMDHRDYVKRRCANRSVLLGRGFSRHGSTISCVSGDGIVREWDYEQDEIVSDHVTGHCDLVSSFTPTHGGNRRFETNLERGLGHPASGMITSSWDGTVRLRTRIRRSALEGV